jgi:hypothetical protein
MTTPINFDLARVGDLWTVTSKTVFADALACGEVIHEALNDFRDLGRLNEAFDMCIERRIPTHVAVVYDPEKKQGAEMNPPKSHYDADLSRYSIDGDNRLIGAFRAPWMRDDAQGVDSLRAQGQAWMRAHSGEQYPYAEVLAFLGLPIAYGGREVCSMWGLASMFATQRLAEPMMCADWPRGWIQCVTADGLQPALLSPYDIHHGLMAMGWGVRRV